MDVINVNAVSLFLEYGVYAIVSGVILTIFFELLVLGIMKAFRLLKL